MMLKINGYEVDIKAKKNSKRMNMKDTMDLLNTISLYLGEAVKWNKDNGYDGCANEAYRLSNDIYLALKAAGLYD